MRPENIGRPILGAIPAILTGIPRTERDPPGASGAQLIGIERHHPPPNPQARPSARFCMVDSISCSA